LIEQIPTATMANPQRARLGMKAAARTATITKSRETGSAQSFAYEKMNAVKM
jgi:hypothetical protein